MQNHSTILGILYLHQELGHVVHWAYASHPILKEVTGWIGKSSTPTSRFEVAWWTILSSRLTPPEYLKRT